MHMNAMHLHNVNTANRTGNIAMRKHKLPQTCPESLVKQIKIKDVQKKKQVNRDTGLQDFVKRKVG